MKKKLKSFFKYNYVGRIVFNVLNEINHISKCVFFSDKAYLKRKFRKVFGYSLNLDNPKTLNEKIQWLKLYDRKDFYAKCTDKYESRDYVKDKVGEEYLVPLYFVTNNPKDIVYDNLPNESFILKATHDSSGGIIIRDKKEIKDWRKVQLHFSYLLKRNFYWGSKEYQYKYLKPKIIAEKLLVCNNRKIPNDYKFHCFNGKVEAVYLSVDREGNNKRNIYDKDWNPLLFTWAPKSKDISNLRGKEIPPPDNYEEMIYVCEKIAEDFPYVRVDLYNVDGKIYVGEITLHHGSGFHHITPAKWDLSLGNLLDLKKV